MSGLLYAEGLRLSDLAEIISLHASELDNEEAKLIFYDAINALCVAGARLKCIDKLLEGDWSEETFISKADYVKLLAQIEDYNILTGGHL